MKATRHGFTLVEILIVVLILGILAAIVIPQFSSATSDARNNSALSMLQSIRRQIEIFKVQHADTPPTLGTNWTIMIGRSTTTEVGSTAGAGTNFGPYLQRAPVNPVNAASAVTNVAPAAAQTTYGWYYQLNGGNYTLQAINTTGGGLLTY